MATKKKVTTKKTAKKVTKKATAKKPATKKAKSIQTVQALREGFKKPNKNNPLPHIRYSNVSISDASNDKFPEMVVITSGPTKYGYLMGKRYVNPTFAMMAVDTAQAESLIGKGRKSVEKELVLAGVTPLDNSMVDISE